MKQKYFWLKLTGTAIILHIALILLSVLEVAVYSYFINPGQDNLFYEAHAKQSAPWISYIFGSLFIFLMVRRYIRRFKDRHLLYAVALPVIYSVIDLMLVLIATTGDNSMATEFLIGKALKILAGLTAYFIYANTSK